MGHTNFQKVYNMILEHVALTITDYNEIEQFYHEILEMNKIKSFVLDKVLAGDIFGIEKETKVFLLQKDELLLEIFLNTEQHHQGFNHICISTSHREKIFKKATQHSYKCLRLKRKNSDMIFVTDNSGNIFEIKQSP
ncbi:MAG: VOC family protein [Thermodesulfobacteriota bacterium]|nr:VOC family protein [Thermodesulfobacteriota bacterium]